jgi:hypothetical protein
MKSANAPAPKDFSVAPGRDASGHAQYRSLTMRFTGGPQGLHAGLDDYRSSARMREADRPDEVERRPRIDYFDRAGCDAARYLHRSPVPRKQFERFRGCCRPRYSSLNVFSPRSDRRIGRAHKGIELTPGFAVVASARELLVRRLPRYHSPQPVLIDDNHFAATERKPSLPLPVL